MRKKITQSFVKPALVHLPLSLMIISSGIARGASDEEVRIAGTGSALGVMKVLSEGFVAVNPTFRAKIYSSIGSSGGIKAVSEGAIDIGLMSRPLKAEESERGLKIIPVARTPLVFIAHENSACTNVTEDMLVSIYSGRLKRCPDGGPIRLILRPPKESDTIILNGLSEAMSRAVEWALQSDGLIMAITDQDSASHVESIPGAFSTSTLALVRSENRRVKVLSFASVAPSLENLAEGTYPLEKRISMVTVEDPRPEVKEFVDYILSPAGGKILAENGCLPMGGASPHE